MLRLHTSEDYSISIKLGTQRTLLTSSPPVAEMSSGRCWLFPRSLPTRKLRVYSLLPWHFPPVCYVPSPCSLRLNNRKGTICREVAFSIHYDASEYGRDMEEKISSSIVWNAYIHYTSRRFYGSGREIAFFIPKVDAYQKNNRVMPN